MSVVGFALSATVLADELLAALASSVAAALARNTENFHFTTSFHASFEIKIRLARNPCSILGLGFSDKVDGEIHFVDEIKILDLTCLRFKLNNC